MRAFSRPRPVLEAARATSVPELVALDMIYGLIWQRRLLIDWEAPLIPTTVAWAAGEDQ